MAKRCVVFLIGVLCLIGASTFSFGAEGVKDRVLMATIYFKNASAELDAQSENELKKVQTVLEADPGIGLQIEGHGAKVGSAEGNREISQKRLQAVRQWFLNQRIDPDRMTIQSPGDSPSAAENAAPPDNFIIERVEIVQMALKLPSAYMPAVNFEFEPVVEGKEITHDFSIQNKGAALLEVQSVRTD